MAGLLDDGPSLQPDVPVNAIASISPKWFRICLLFKRKLHVHKRWGSWREAVGTPTVGVESHLFAIHVVSLESSASGPRVRHNMELAAQMVIGGKVSEKSDGSGFCGPQYGNKGRVRLWFREEKKKGKRGRKTGE